MKSFIDRLSTFHDERKYTVEVAEQHFTYKHTYISVFILPEFGLVVSSKGPLVTLVEHIRRPSASTARFWRSIVTVVKENQTAHKTKNTN